MNRKKSIFGGCIVVIMLIAIYFAISNYRPVAINAMKEYKNLGGNLILPESTKVIINASTYIDPNADFFPSHFSKNYYFDSNGTMLGSFQIEDQILNDYIVEGSHWIAYFFKNFTLLSNKLEYKIIDQVANKDVLNNNSGATKTNYIPDKDLFYAYFNIGFLDNKYRSVIRFVSENKNYDIFIPYFLLSLNYDKEKQQIVCFLGKSNEDLPDDTFGYCVLNFDENSQKFIADETLQMIPYFTNKSDQQVDPHPPAILVKNNMAYMVSEFPSEEYFTSLNLEKNEYMFDVRLVLTKINLETKYVEHKIIKDSYQRNKNNNGYIFGSTDLPVTPVHDKLYVFTSDFKVLIIEDENNIKEISMPYSFKNTISLKNYLTKYNEGKDFFDSDIYVDENETIYILNLFQNNDLKIHTLLNDGTYELVWEGKMPSDMPRDTFISSFELINTLPQ